MINNKTINSISFWIGFVGGGILCAIYTTIDGRFPDAGEAAFLGGLGALLFGGLARIILFIKYQTSNEKTPNTSIQSNSLISGSKFSSTTPESPINISPDGETLMSIEQYDRNKSQQMSLSQSDKLELNLVNCPHCLTKGVLPMPGHKCPNCKKSLDSIS